MAVDTKSFCCHNWRNVVAFRVFQFKNVDDATDLPDILKRVKFSCISWTHDNRGIFYNVR